MRKFYVNVTGGLGYNIAFASFATALKKKHPDDFKIYVCSPYWDVFECCPAIDGVYKPNELKDLIFDAEANDGELVIHRLYDMDGFIKKRLTYSQAWAKLLNVIWEDEVGSNTVSVLEPYGKFPNLRQGVEDVKKTIRDKGYTDYIIMQFTGGQSPLTTPPTVTDDKGNQVPDWSKVPYDYDNEPLKRHYPINLAQEFVDRFSKEHPSTAMLFYQLPNEPLPQNQAIFRFTIPYLSYYELAKDPMCRGTVSIDSSLQHLVAGMTKSLVLWGHSVNCAGDKLIQLPFGYSYNINIIQPCRRSDILFFTALGPSGAKIEYISPEKLLEHVNKLYPGDAE